MKKDEKESQTIELEMNLTAQPIYADYIVNVGINRNVAKLILANKTQDHFGHTATIVVPTSALIELKKFLNSDDFDKAIEKHS